MLKQEAEYLSASQTLTYVQKERKIGEPAIIHGGLCRRERRGLGPKARKRPGVGLSGLVGGAEAKEPAQEPEKKPACPRRGQNVRRSQQARVFHRD